MKILSIYSIKGGVGKTAAAVNLGWLAAASGLKVLIWDLDPQSAATFYFRVKPKLRKKMSRAISGKHDLDREIKATDFEGLDLIPSAFSNRNLDLMLDAAKKSTRMIRQLAKPLKDDCDLMILDCPPGITLLSESTLHAADLVAVPVIPTILSARTAEMLATFLSDSDIKTTVRAFFSMVDRRKKLHREMLAMPDIGGITLMPAAIPYASDVEKMGIHRAPLHAFAPSGAAAEGYRNLWHAVQSGLGLDGGAS